MDEAMPFELVAMTRTDGMCRRTIPSAERRAGMEPRLSLLLVEDRAAVTRHRLDRLRRC